MPLPHLRFSLSSLVLLTAVVALGVAVWRLGSEIGPLRRENKRLNEERGTLVIENRESVNAIHIPERFAGNPGTFRVFIPEGSTYRAIAAVNNIPKTGLPEVGRRDARIRILGQAGANAFSELSAGEHQVSLSVEQRKNGDRYVRFAATPQGFWLDMQVQIPKGVWPEVTPETYSVYEEGVCEATQAVVAGQPLVLLRYRTEMALNERRRVSYSTSTPEPDYPLDGMMLWIEPIEEDAP